MNETEQTLRQEIERWRNRYEAVARTLHSLQFLQLIEVAWNGYPTEARKGSVFVTAPNPELWETMSNFQSTLIPFGTDLQAAVAAVRAAENAALIECKIMPGHPVSGVSTIRHSSETFDALLAEYYSPSNQDRPA